MTRYTTNTDAEGHYATELAQVAIEAATEAVENHIRRNGDRVPGPFTATIECDPGDEADREVSAPDDEPNEALRRAAESHDRYTGRDGWIRPSPNGSGRPIHPMDVVQVDYGRLAATPRGYKEKPVRTAYQPAWSRVEYYRPLRDEEGVPYCSAEGLNVRAEYVATDESGRCYGWTGKPDADENEWLIARYADVVCKAEQHANTRDHWTQTLRRVWRKGE